LSVSVRQVRYSPPTRIVTGTRQHAVRRAHEMAAAAQLLTDLRVAPILATASQHLHERLAAE
jgi:hypothetical protein